MKRMRDGVQVDLGYRGERAAEKKPNCCPKNVLLDPLLGGEPPGPQGHRQSLTAKNSDTPRISGLQETRITGSQRKLDSEES